MKHELDDDPISILSSPAFAPVRYRERYESLAERLELDFSDILFAFDFIPLALTGEAHRIRRASFARMLKARQEVIAPEIPALVEKHFARLSEPGRLDILSSCVEPFVTEFLADLSGAPSELDLSLVSRIFSRNLGIAKRRRLQEQLRTARETLTRLFPEDGEDAIGERLALLILGRDAVTGTLARSLHHTLEQACGRPLCESRPAKVPTRTGVPFIDRQAVQDTNVDGRDYRAGDVVRCTIQTLEADAQPDHLRFFGKGAHVCLGRALSLMVFDALGSFLSTLPVRVTEIEFTLRKDDVFLFPEEFTGMVLDER